jgi:hemerythrin superfamily protein
MQIRQLLHKEHQKVLQISERLIESSDRAIKTRQQQLARLREALLPHMESEEEFFYPFLLENCSQRGQVHEAFEEHAAARKVLQDIEGTDVADESWVPKMRVLHELLEHHIQEEEGELFEMTSSAVDDRQARQMGQQFHQIEGRRRQRYAA